MGRRRQRRSPWVRTRLAAGATAALVVAGLATAAGPLAAAPAAPASARAPAAMGVRAQDQAAVQPQGHAKAVAVVSRVAPGVGALELAAEMGTSITEVTNTIAQAQSKAVDLGLVGTALTAGACRDGLRPEDLPQPTRVDNRDGDAEAVNEEVPAGAASGLRMLARATTAPSSYAQTTAAQTGLDDVLTVGGGEAEAWSRIEPDGTRHARGVVEMDLDLAGVVQLGGLRWTALHETGGRSAAEGTFEVASAEAGGIPLPLDEMAPLQAAINEALAQTGIRVELPRVERLTEPSDLVRVTPMRIIIRDSPLGATLLGPILDVTRTARSDLFVALSEAICDASGILLTGDVIVSIVAGTGFLALELGGAEAMTADRVLGNPFGDHLPLQAPGPPAPPPEEPPPVAAADEAAPGPPAATPTTGEPPATTELAAELPTAPVSAVERLCESVHPFQWPSCSHGAAVPLGLLGLGATALMAGLDLAHQRRRLARVGSAPTGAAA